MKKFRKKIYEEINNNFKDVNDKICKSINWEEVKINNENRKTKKENKTFKFVLLPMLASIMLCLIIAVPFMFGSNTTTPAVNEYTLTISINPRVELKANSQDVVTSQKGLNEDGCLLLLKENLIGKPLNNAVNDIVKISGDMGYLTKGHNIKLAIKTDKGEFDFNKQEKIRENMNQFLNVYGGPMCNIMSLSEKEIDDIEDYYENKNLSDYEKNLAQKFKEHLNIITRKKLFDTNQLMEFLSSYLIESENIIPNFQEGIMHLTNYAMQYKFNLKEYDLSSLTYEDIMDIFEELQDDRDELFEAINLFDEGKSEDDFKDKLEDLFEMAKDMIKEEIDD